MLTSIGKYFEKLKAKLFPVEEKPTVYVQQTDERNTFYVDVGDMPADEVEKALENIKEDIKQSPFDIAQEFIKPEPVKCKPDCECTCKSKTKTKTTGKGKPRRSRSNRGRGQRSAKAGSKR